MRSRRGSYITVTGKFPSVKTDHMSRFEGLRERDYFLLLDYDDEVESFRPHPLRINYKLNGKSRVYTPDVLVTYTAASGRRQELTEIKTRKHLRKDWAKFRNGFRAAQRHCREKGWRFRLVDNRILGRPFVRILHFLRGFRILDADSEIEKAIGEELAKREDWRIATLAHEVAVRGFDEGETIAQIWRLLSLGKISTDFELTLTMNSPVTAQPWRLSDLLAKPWKRTNWGKEMSEMEDTIQSATAVESLGSGGTDVVPLARGEIYARSDKPGQYALVQFESAESITVREVGSTALEVIDVRLLRPFSMPRARERMELKELSEDALKLANQRLESIRPFTEKRRVDRKQANEAAEKLGVSTKTWLGYLREYRRNPVLPSLLRKQRSDAGKVRFNEEVEALIRKHIGLCLQSSDTISNAHTNLSDEIKAHNKANPAHPLKIPEYSTFYSRFHLKSPISASEERDGKRLARLRYGLDRGKLEGINAPLQVVQIDHTELPVVVVDKKTRVAIRKPWITVVIDIFSRMVVGFYLTLEKPGNLSTGLAIANAILPKDEWLKEHGVNFAWPCSGLMRVIHADNAGEFHGNMLELACNAYLVELIFRVVKKPNYGGYIESYLGTMTEKLRHFPGATLGGPDELGDRKPEEEAVATLDEIEAWLLNLLAEYHHAEHSSLDGQSPIARWRDGFRGSSVLPGIGNVHIPKDTMKLRLDFLPLIERTVGTKGILWDYFHYSTPALQRWVGARDPKRKVLARQFICRRDPRDLSHIYFWDPERKEYLDIPYRNPTRPRITLWEHQAARQFLIEHGRKEIDEDLLFEAREKRNRILLEAKTKTEEAKRAREHERTRQAKEQAEKLQRDLGNDDVKGTAQEKRLDGLMDEADVPLFEDAQA